MPDDERDVAEKIFEKMSEQRWGEKYPTCGSHYPESLVFACEGCGKRICSLYHNMTDDFEQICGDCVKAKGLTRNDL